ncbi:hypothetical protein BacF7301_04965 [Bacteroides faecium]|uniref:Uncharacterized protein n=1 Tax=Bacteroides faecium TaxID=2715212 RepID=A0A6H0KGZ1_9BACE|nr:hypothetical protein [Bacteroides faecium]QIU92630.1 hypothetical protein BacF7301_04965 [Bacteroides faecium]
MEYVSSGRKLLPYGMMKNAIGTTRLYKIVVVYKGMEMRVCEEVNS